MGTVIRMTLRRSPSAQASIPETRTDADVDRETPHPARRVAPAAAGPVAPVGGRDGVGIHGRSSARLPVGLADQAEQSVIDLGVVVDLGSVGDHRVPGAGWFESGPVVFRVVFRVELEADVEP
jgi:hypothetical protein